MSIEAVKSTVAPGGRSAVPLAALISLALLSGCAAFQKDHVIVGSVPDDYRTNHPIIVGEKQLAIDIPVTYDGYRMTRGQRDAVDGFLADYDRKTGSPVVIMTPSDSANSAATASVASEMARFARKTGVTNVQVVNYASGASEASAPIRVTYHAIRASTGPCGRWPDDLTNTADNRHYANFGCASQNNLAAQVANPNDLIGPRRPSEIDAARRGNVIGDYQGQISDWSPESDYEW